MSKRSLKRGGERPQAWLGTAVTIASALAGLYNNYRNAKNEQEARQQSIDEQNRQTRLNNSLLAASTRLTNHYNYIDELERERINNLMVKCGGKIKLANGGKVNNLGGNAKIIRGGYAEPLDSHTFLLQGRSHAQGGIDIDYGKGNKSVGINAERNEVDEELGPNTHFIYSNSIMLPNGLTPAQAVRLGYNRRSIRAYQQSVNGNNTNTPVKRNKAAIGTTIQPIDWVNLGANTITALGSGMINDYFNSRTKTNLIAPKYYEQAPVILNKDLKIGARLSLLDRMRLANNRNISENTASSNVALARMMQNNYDIAEKQRELFDEKSNYFTEQSNKERQLNAEIARNDVNNRIQNSREVAETLNKQTALWNEKLLRRGDIGTTTSASLNKGLTNFYNIYNTRKENDDMMNAYIALGGPGTAERLQLGGVNLPFETRLGLYNKYKNSDKEEEIELVNSLIPTFTRRQSLKYNIGV